MKNILLIAPRFHTNQYYMIRHLLKKNTVSFIALYKGSIEDYTFVKPKTLAQSNISIKLQSIFNLRYDTLYFPKIIDLYRKIKKIKPDLIILRIYSRPLLYIVSFLAKIFKCKIVYYDQTPLIKFNNFISYLKYCESIIARYIFSAAWYSPILLEPKEKYSIPFLVKTKKKINFIKDRYKILMIGKFQSRKGHFLLLKVFSELIKKYRIHLTIIGEVSNREHIKNFNYINSYIKNKNLADVCKIKTNIKFKAIDKEYEDCNLFVLPSYSEPAAISILEAQGLGRPVVCSDTCGTRTYLNESSSRIFKSNDPNSLSTSIKYFLDRQNNYNKFINKSYENAIKNFSQEKFESDFTNFLNKNF
jgi:glycosyltransferase involved in cell wall biosynthesis